MSVTIKSSQTSEAKNFIKSAQSLKSKVAKVGWFTYYTTGESVASVALQNELGNPAKNIPARPFITPTIHQQSDKWINLMKYGIKRVLKGEETIEDTLERVGQRASADIKKTIANGDFLPLAQSTIQARLRKKGIDVSAYEEHKKFIGPRKKGHVDTKLGLLDKPLVDTGYMRDSITTVIEDEKGSYQ